MNARAPVGHAGAVMAVLIAAIAAHAADRRMPGADVFWARHDFATVAPASIALLPATSFDRDPESERLAAVGWAQNFSRREYRWLSANTSRTLIAIDAAGDSLMKLAREGALKSGRVDSLLAPALCARLRVQAVMSVRIEQWEQQAIQRDESGKPWTRIQLRAALVDTLGRLMWTASGGETVEGAYQEAQRAATGADATAPRSEFAAGEGAPPPFSEALSRLITRWSAAFPSRPAPAAAP